MSHTPFDMRRGVIPSENGRVNVSGLYCSGWVKNGPVGVIATTMNDAFRTGQLVVQDLKSGEIKLKSQNKGFEVISSLLHSRGVKPVSFDQWRKIDQVEQERGRKLGKPREKIISVQEMLDIAYKHEES